MSMPEIACVTEPPRPCQNVAWWSFSETRSGSMADSPTKWGFRRSRAASTRALLVATLPRPVRPLSVCTSTSVCRFSDGGVSAVQPDFGVAPRRAIVRMLVIFTSNNLCWKVRTAKGLTTDNCGCGPKR